MSVKITPNTLKKIEQLFEEANYILRYEKGSFNSGYCVLEDKRVVVVNKFLNTEGKINTLIDILPRLNFNIEELSPESAKFFQLIADETKLDLKSIQIKLDLNDK